MRREIRQVQFLVDVDAPVVVQRQGYGRTVQKIVLVPQLQFIESRRSPFVPQRQIPMVLPVQKTIETPQLQSVRWSMPLLKTVEVPQIQLLCGCGRRCDLAATSSPLCREVPQTCSSTRCSSPERFGLWFNFTHFLHEGGLGVRLSEEFHTFS